MGKVSDRKVVGGARLVGPDGRRFRRRIRLTADGRTGDVAGREAGPDVRGGDVFEYFVGHLKDEKKKRFIIFYLRKDKKINIYYLLSAKR